MFSVAISDGNESPYSVNSPSQKICSPITLSPSPTPLSSPSLFTSKSGSLGNQYDIEKWKEIGRKLSFHTELRSIWNQLKVNGKFLTNEHFMSHLLRHEAERQCIQYDVLSVNEPHEVSTDIDPLLTTYTSQFSDVSELHSMNDEPFEKSMQNVLHKKESSGIKKDTEVDLYQQSDSSNENCVLTVLDSQRQCTQQDSTGLCIVSKL